MSVRNLHDKRQNILWQNFFTRSQSSADSASSLSASSKAACATCMK